MKVMAKGITLADIDLSTGDNDMLLAKANLLNQAEVKLGAQVKMEKTKEGLFAHVRVPGQAKFDLFVETKDITALKGLMNSAVLKFMVGAFMKG